MQFRYIHLSVYILEKCTYDECECNKTKNVQLLPSELVGHRVLYLIQYRDKRITSVIYVIKHSKTVCFVNKTLVPQKLHGHN